MVLCVGTELKVYDITGATLLGTLPATGVSWSKMLGGGGFLSATCDERFAPLATATDMLDDCVIKVGIDTGTGTFTQVAAYANRSRNGTIWDGAGTRTREIRQAPTLLTTWLQDAILHTEANAIPQFASPMDGQRYFGYQSSIYDPDRADSALWGTPSDTVGQQDSTAGDRASQPNGWPTELGNAYWITRGTTNNGDRHLFIADCVVPTACYLKVFFSADESCTVWWAGEKIITTDSSETGYKDIHVHPMWVEAGTYRVAISKLTVVSRGGDGYDPVLCGVATMTTADAVDDVLLVTDDSWLVYTMDAFTGEAPSLTPGEIVLELLDQAQTRGVTTLTGVTTDVTAAEDSDAVAWPVREERAWRIGFDTMFDMFESLGDLPFAPDLTPGLVLQVFSAQGTDRSATVVLEALVDVDSVQESGVGVAATVLPVLTDDGWVTVENAAAIATHGRREQGLSLGNAPSTAQGRRLGQEVLDTRLAIATSEWTVEHYATATSTPFADYFLGDTVTVRVGGVDYTRVVLDIGASAESTEAIIRWTTKTGPVLGEETPT